MLRKPFSIHNYEQPNFNDSQELLVNKGDKSAIVSFKAPPQQTRIFTNSSLPLRPDPLEFRSKSSSSKLVLAPVCSDNISDQFEPINEEEFNNFDFKGKSETGDSQILISEFSTGRFATFDGTLVKYYDTLSPNANERWLFNPAREVTSLAFSKNYLFIGSDSLFVLTLETGLPKAKISLPDTVSKLIPIQEMLYIITKRHNLYSFSADSLELSKPIASDIYLGCQYSKDELVLYTDRALYVCNPFTNSCRLITAAISGATNMAIAADSYVILAKPDHSNDDVLISIVSINSRTSKYLRLYDQFDKNTQDTGDNRRTCIATSSHSKYAFLLSSGQFRTSVIDAEKGILLDIEDLNSIFTGSVVEKDLTDSIRGIHFVESPIPGKIENWGIILCTISGTVSYYDQKNKDEVLLKNEAPPEISLSSEPLHMLPELDSQSTDQQEEGAYEAELAVDFKAIKQRGEFCPSKPFLVAISELYGMIALSDGERVTVYPLEHLFQDNKKDLLWKKNIPVNSLAFLDASQMSVLAVGNDTGIKLFNTKSGSDISGIKIGKKVTSIVCQESMKSDFYCIADGTIFKVKLAGQLTAIAEGGEAIAVTSTDEIVFASKGTLFKLVNDEPVPICSIFSNCFTIGSVIDNRVVCFSMKNETDVNYAAVDVTNNQLLLSESTTVINPDSSESVVLVASHPKSKVVSFVGSGLDQALFLDFNKGNPRLVTINETSQLTIDSDEETLDPLNLRGFFLIGKQIPGVSSSHFFLLATEEATPEKNTRLSLYECTPTGGYRFIDGDLENIPICLSIDSTTDIARLTAIENDCQIKAIDKESTKLNAYGKCIHDLAFKYNRFDEPDNFGETLPGLIAFSVEYCAFAVSDGKTVRAFYSDHIFVANESPEIWSKEIGEAVSSLAFINTRDYCIVAVGTESNIQLINFKTGSMGGIIPIGKKVTSIVHGSDLNIEDFYCLAEGDVFIVDLNESVEKVASDAEAIAVTSTGALVFASKGGLYSLEDKKPSPVCSIFEDCFSIACAFNNNVVCFSMKSKTDVNYAVVNVNSKSVILQEYTPIIDKTQNHDLFNVFTVGNPRGRMVFFVGSGLEQVKIISFDKDGVPTLISPEDSCEVIVPIDEEEFEPYEVKGLFIVDREAGFNQGPGVIIASRNTYMDYFEREQKGIVHMISLEEGETLDILDLNKTRELEVQNADESIDSPKTIKLFKSPKHFSFLPSKQKVSLVQTKEMIFDEEILAFDDSVEYQLLAVATQSMVFIFNKMTNEEPEMIDIRGVNFLSFISWSGTIALAMSTKEESLISIYDIQKKNPYLKLFGFDDVRDIIHHPKMKEKFFLLADDNLYQFNLVTGQQIKSIEAVSCCCCNGNGSLFYISKGSLYKFGFGKICNGLPSQFTMIKATANPTVFIGVCKKGLIALDYKLGKARTIGSTVPSLVEPHLSSQLVSMAFEQDRFLALIMRENFDEYVFIEKRSFIDEQVKPMKVTKIKWSQEVDLEVKDAVKEIMYDDEEIKIDEEEKLSNLILITAAGKQLLFEIAFSNEITVPQLKRRTFNISNPQGKKCMPQKVSVNIITPIPRK